MKSRAILVIMSLILFSACGDTSSKSGGNANSSNNVNNANNVNHANNTASPRLANYCAMNTGVYECEEPDRFSVSLEIKPDCGTLGEFETECGITPENLELCRSAIESCPEQNTETIIGESCDVLFRCAPEPENNTNNTNRGNNTNNVSYTAEFRQVANILREGCLQSECHGGFGSTNFSVPSGSLATEAEIQAAIDGVQAENGNFLVVPDSPNESELYLILLSGDEVHGLPAQQLDTLENWILNGAIYTE